MPQPYPNGELVIVIDCSDLDCSARFRAAVLGYRPAASPAARIAVSRRSAAPTP